MYAADAATVLNVGAGAGSYEPTGRVVTPVEPSASMRAARPPELAPALDAVAEELPFADRRFDAAMTTFSVHQWGDLERGLAEMRPVTTGPNPVGLSRRVQRGLLRPPRGPAGAGRTAGLLSLESRARVRA